MSDQISLLFPADLYKLIVIRSGGRLDPAQLAIDLVENFVSTNKDKPSIWAGEGLSASAELAEMPKYGDPDRGHFWSPLMLKNGTELRMRYKHKSHYARVSHEQVIWEGRTYDSVSRWVRAVAENTSRNAWHDVWFKRPDDSDFLYSDAIRRDLLRAQFGFR